MIQFIKNHKFFIIMSAAIVGVLAFAVSKPSSETAVASPFRSVNINSSMIKGSTDAPVDIIQYSDFLCPSCSVFSTQVVPSIEQEYINSNQAKFEFRPMAFIAEGSTLAGAGAFCAVEQNKFWEYHDATYIYVANKIFNEGMDPTRDTILTTPLIKNIAVESGLDPVSFNTCMDSGRHLDSIENSTKEANDYGVTGTPYIMVNGTQFKGQMTFDAIDALIKASL